MGKPRLTSLAIAVELAAAIIFGLLMYFVIGSIESASMITGIGILLSLATYLLKEELEGLLTLMVDHYRRSHDVTFAISQIEDPECRNRARQLLDGIMRNVPLLQAGFIPLDETEFLVAAAQAVDEATKTVKSVNPLSMDWSKRAGFIRYYESNLQAIARGVTFTRIFVISEKRLSDPDVQQSLLMHYKDGFDVRIVLREELPPPSDSAWTSNCSFNFALYDDEKAVDVKDTGTYYGMKTSRFEEVQKYIRLFGLIEHNARAAILSDGRIGIKR